MDIRTIMQQLGCSHNCALTVVFWIGLVLAGVGPPFLILIGFGEAGWAALISGVVMMLASRFEDIVEFSVGPLRAKLREKVQEADTTLAEIRNLASLVASTSLSLVKRQGGIGGYTDEEQEKIAQEVRDVLEKVGTDETRIDELFEEWHRNTEREYVHLILGGNVVPDGATDAQSDQWKALRRRWIDNLPQPEELTEFLRSGNFLTADREAWIEDYRFYRENRSHNRPEVWEQRKVQRLRVQPEGG